MSLQSILANSARALDVFTTAIEVSSHNVANVNTPGFVRDELELASSKPYQRGQLLLGTGVDATGVRQQIDLYLEQRIHTATGSALGSGTRLDYLRQLESELRELGGADLSTAITNFAGSLEDVAQQPADGALRQIAVQQGTQFAETITSLRSRIDNIRGSQGERIEALVSEANGLIDTIADLNRQLRPLEANGIYQSDAGALRTERYNALGRLSEIVPIDFHEQPDGSVSVFSDSSFLVLGQETQHLETVNRVDRGVIVQDLRLAETGSPITTTESEIGGILTARDADLGGFVDELDRLTSGVIDIVNRIHSGGEGLSGYEELTANVEVDDSTVPLNQLELPSEIVHGSFELKVVDQDTGLVETTRVEVDLDGIGTDTSLDDLATTLTGIDGVTASVNSRGQLELVADEGIEFKFAADTSGVLSALGINTLFHGTDSTDIRVNPQLLDDPDLLATGQGGGAGDNRNILALAQFHQQGSTSLGDLNATDFYERLVTELAQETANTNVRTESQVAFQFSLRSQREQISGVDIDEETVKILQFQRNYQAAARVVQTADELLQVLLSIG